MCCLVCPPRSNPVKHTIKNVYLDALGEPQDSPRRTYSTGLQTQYTLNRGVAGREMDLLLLDERYFREMMPCSRRQAFCAQVRHSNGKRGWSRCSHQRCCFLKKGHVNA